MAREQVVSATGSTTDADLIRTASATAAGAVVLDGTTSFANASLVTITSSGNDSANHFTIVGTGPGGALTEIVTGANAGVATSTLYFSSITSVTAEDAVTAPETISIGVINSGSTPWVQFDHYANQGVAIQITVSGTVDYTLQQTLDNPNRNNLLNGSTITPSTVTWVNSSDSAVVTTATTAQTNYMFPPAWARIIINSGSGAVTGTFVQGG